MDPFKPFRRGEKFIPQADFLNELQEMLKWWHRQIGTKAGPVVVPSETEIWVKNSNTLKHRPQYSIISLGTQLVAPDAEKSFFFGKGIFEIAAPVASSPFAILQSPAHMGGGIVEARIGGWSWCVLMQNSISHTWANPVTNEYDFLTSASSGMAKVIWDGDAIVAPVATTLSNAIGPDDLDIDVTATAGWDAIAVNDLFVVTIQSEDILIERVDSSAWRARQRGYNSTTKAGHAVNVSVTFKAGCVWGLVGWDERGEVAGGSGITSINGDTAAAQVFSVGTSGTDFAITDTGAGTLRWDLPSASATARGAVTTAAQTIGGIKTFTNQVITNAHFQTDLSGTGYSISNFGSTADSVASVYINTAGDDSNGNDNIASVFLYVPVRNIGNTTWVQRTHFVINGSAEGSILDTQPSFAVDDGTTIHFGLWDTDPIGNVFKGGLLITKSTVTPVADGTYTVGLGISVNGTITVDNGLITAITEAS